MVVQGALRFRCFRARLSRAPHQPPKLHGQSATSLGWNFPCRKNPLVFLAGWVDLATSLERTLNATCTKRVLVTQRFLVDGAPPPHLSTGRRHLTCRRSAATSPVDGGRNACQRGQIALAGTPAQINCATSLSRGTFATAAKRRLPARPRSSPDSKMVHQGGATSKTSRALANVRRQLKTKQTRGRKPRGLTDAEIAHLKDQQESLVRQLEASAVDRAEGQRSRQRELNTRAKMLHERLQRALQGSAKAEQDLVLATEAREWLWEHLCWTVIDQVNLSSREEHTTMVYMLVRSMRDGASIGVEDIKAFRKKMYLLLHPDKNKQPGAGAAFGKFRRQTDDLLARLTRMPLYPYRPTANPTQLQLTLQAQLEEREALQEILPSLAKKLQMAAEELRDAGAAWDAVQNALPASARKARPVVCTDSSQGWLCHRCAAAPCPLTRFWCAACSRQLAGR